MPHSPSWERKAEVEGVAENGDSGPVKQRAGANGGWRWGFQQ